jgi:hypothetical protein
MNIGQPEDKFDEEKIEREELVEELGKMAEKEEPAQETLPVKEELNDDVITEIIALFARDIDGIYYGKYGAIGEREKCIEWVRDILKGRECEPGSK